MSNNLLAPICPYCGVKMQSYYEQSFKGASEYVSYRCPEHFIGLPRKEIDYGDTVNNVSVNAYNAAITRWNERNVLLPINAPSTQKRSLNGRFYIIF